MVKELKDIKEKIPFLEKDSNGREINIYKLRGVVTTGESLFYPNVLFKVVETGEIFNPINETTMSLKNVIKDYVIVEQMVTNKIEKVNMFFFVYNTDNYYHFLYDTIPYLITYLELLKTDPNIKLLMNYPNPTKKEHYKFVIEFLKLLGITEDNISIIDGETLYDTVLFSTSYTHDFDSNLPPRPEVYKFLQELALDIKCDFYHKDTPKKIYISRRTWKHGDFSNIGTNYTTRRKLMNEDVLVEFLESKGYTEVFTETMSTREKINIFANAEKVIGAIGGGLSNVLFSNKNCQLITIVSPTFLEVNERFLFSFSNVNTTLFNKVSLFEFGDLKTYMRVKVGDLIGEIVGIKDDKVTIAYSDTKVTGWNNEITFKTKTVDSYECVKLDNGLNSSWIVDLDELKKLDL